MKMMSDTFTEIRPKGRYGFSQYMRICKKPCPVCKHPCEKKFYSSSPIGKVCDDCNGRTRKHLVVNSEIFVGISRLKREGEELDDTLWRIISKHIKENPQEFVVPGG